MKPVINNWAKAAGIIAICLIIFVLIYNDHAGHVRSIAILNLAFLMLHQFEEYVYPGGFKEFFITNIAGRNKLLKFPISDKGILIVNILIGWGAYSMGIVSPNPLFVMILIFTAFMNGIVHSAAFFVLRKYNPGLFTGVFIFIPFTLWAYNEMSGKGYIHSSDLPLIITFAVIGTILIPVTVFLTSDRTK